MSDKFARVTLLSPFLDVNGVDIDEVKLRYGYEPARLISGGYWGGDAVPMSERAWEDGSGRPPKYTRGAPIDYAMKWSNAEYRSVVVPEHVAMHYFGDWTIVPGMDQNFDFPERVYSVEKNRVASLWGGYAREKRDRNIEGHWRSLRKTGPPNVPRVTISRLDAAQRGLPGTAYEPWAHFQWEKECIVPESLAPAMPASPGVFLTPAQLQELVSTEVANALKSQKKVPA